MLRRPLPPSCSVSRPLCRIVSPAASHSSALPAASHAGPLPLFAATAATESATFALRSTRGVFDRATGGNPADASAGPRELLTPCGYSQPHLEARNATCALLPARNATTSDVRASAAGPLRSTRVALGKAPKLRHPTKGTPATKTPATPAEVAVERDAARFELPPPCGYTQKALHDLVDKHDPGSPRFKLYFFTLADVTGISQSLRRVFDTWPDDAKTDRILRCLKCGHTVSEHKSHGRVARAGPFELLTDANLPLAAPDDWLLAYPLFDRRTAPTAHVRGRSAWFAAAQREVAQTLARDDGRGPLMLGIAAGMGMGKSHLLDVIDQFLFVGQEPVVLTVRYDLGQHFPEEGKEGQVRPGLFARLVLAAHRRASPFDCMLVEKAIYADAARPSKTLEAPSVARWVRERVPARPIIVAVDEVVKLGQKRAESVISAVAAFVEQVYKQSGGAQAAIGVVTALPTLNITSLTGRPLKIMRPRCLSPEESEELLVQQCSSLSHRSGFADRIAEMLQLCVGHPRSLAAAAALFTRENGTVPEPHAVATHCHWTYTYDHLAGGAEIPQFVCDAYRSGRAHEGQEGFTKLRELCTLIDTEDGDYAIAPTVLFSRTDGRDICRSKIDHLRAMFRLDTSRAPAKKLADVNYHWEMFKAANKLPVVPPTMRVPTPARMYCFDTTKKPATQSVLSKDPNGKLRLKRIDPSTYYLPSGSHRGFDSMCVAASADQKTQVLCLLHCKLNDDAADAVDGLNQAAEELKAIWSGEFLFVVFALHASDEAAAMSEAKHPVAVVHRGNMAAYFTATLAPAAALCLMRHRRELADTNDAATRKTRAGRSTSRNKN